MRMRTQSPYSRSSWRTKAGGATQRHPAERADDQRIVHRNLPALCSAALCSSCGKKGYLVSSRSRPARARRTADPAVTAVVADWPLGRRDRALLDLHAAWFGPRLEGWTSCPSCGEKVEFVLDARELATDAANGPPHDAVMVAAYASPPPTTSRPGACHWSGGGGICHRTAGSLPHRRAGNRRVDWRPARGYRGELRLRRSAGRNPARARLSVVSTRVGGCARHRTFPVGASRVACQARDVGGSHAGHRVRLE